MALEKNIYNKVFDKFMIKNNILIGEKVPENNNDKNFADVIINSLDKLPDEISQIDVSTDKTTTFGEMKDRSIRLAIWLSKQNIGKGDIISVCTHNHLNSYLPILSTLYVGATLNAWHFELTIKLARDFIKLVQPKIMISCENTANIIQEAAKLEKIPVKIVVFGNVPGFQSIYDIIDEQSNSEVLNFIPAKVTGKKDAALMMFSSGTTGFPKGVLISYGTLLSSLATFPAFSKVNMLWYSSLYWVSGTIFTLNSIINNSTRILHQDFDPEETCKIIEKYNVHFLFASPTMVMILLKSKVLQKYKLTNFKKCLAGGSKLHKETLEELKLSLPYTDVLTGYGMTEVAGSVSSYNKSIKNIDSVGHVAKNIEIKINDVETNKPLGPNEVGEICIKSPNVMIGYHKNPKATAEAIDSEGWYHTGDIGYYDENGEIFITDRIKEIMKFRGHHVSPNEIEEVLLTHPGVMEVAVVPVPHLLDVERPMAFVRKNHSHNVTEEELIELSAELGNNKKLWGGVQFLDNLPYTPSGKINKKELKEMAKLYAES